MERAGDGTSIAEGERLNYSSVMTYSSEGMPATECKLLYLSRLSGMGRRGMPCAQACAKSQSADSVTCALCCNVMARSKTQGNTKAEVQYEQASGRIRKEQYAHEGKLAFRRQTTASTGRLRSALSQLRGTVLNARTRLLNLQF